MNQQTFEYINSLKNKEKIRILFVCLGNICRSPSAQGIMESLIEEKGLGDRFEIDSAGTYGGHAGELPDHRMRIHARGRGYHLNHRSRKFQTHDFENFDLIIGMDGYNLSQLKSLAPTLEDERKVVGMIGFVKNFPQYDSVPDPYYEGSEGFEIVLNLLEDGCRNLLQSLDL